MSNFGTIPTNPEINFGFSEDDKPIRSCCLNETTRFDLTLTYEAGSVVQTAYALNYVAYLKCQKKCPKDSFTTSDRGGGAPIQNGKEFLWATWKQSQECTICKKDINYRAAQCGTKGDDTYGGVQHPPITHKERAIIGDFIIAMNPPNEVDIKALMLEFMTTVCHPRAECGPLAAICAGAPPPPPK